MKKTHTRKPAERTLLAIETSCDETSAAVLVWHAGALPRLASCVVASQVALHAPFGGVVPMLAAREQQRNIEPVITQALRDGARDLKDITHLAVTRGPGLPPTLHVGVNYARAMAFALGVPLVGVNHLEGHLYSTWFGAPDTEAVPSAPLFPALNLIVSGGHTELVLMRGHGDYQLLGETQDDAAGEAFDKVARMMGLPYPGGPALAREAERGDATAFAFPRPMLGAKNYHFSFSGLKTAVLYAIQALPGAPKRPGEPAKLPPQMVRDIAASFQAAAVEVLVEKTIRAARALRVATVLVSGGVSANRALRDGMTLRMRTELPAVAVRVPHLAYTGDNAAMIGMAAYWHLRGRRGRAVHEDVVADPNLRLATTGEY